MVSEQLLRFSEVPNYSYKMQPWIEPRSHGVHGDRTDLYAVADIYP